MLHTRDSSFNIESPQNNSNDLRYEAHYALPLGRKKGAKLTDAEEAAINKKRSKKTQAKYTERQKESKVEQALLDQFMTGTGLFDNKKW